MPSPPLPPPPPAPGEVYVATCRALLALAAPAERDDARAQSIAEVAVREAIGEGYRVEALGPGARDYRVSRADGALLAAGTAWTLTRALLAHRDIADAEPAIDQPGLEPPPGTLGPARCPSGGRAPPVPR